MEIDWRDELQPHTRIRVVKKIMNYINEYHDIDDEDELQEFEKLCRSFEQKTFASATSKSDYKNRLYTKKVEMEMINISYSKAGASLLSQVLEGKLHEEMCQKIKMFKEVYLPELIEMYQKIANRHQQIQMLREVNLPELTEMFKFTSSVQQQHSLPQQAELENHEALSFFKEVFKSIPSSLAVPSQIWLILYYRNGMIGFEKKILDFINSNRHRKIYNVQPGEVSSHAMLSLSQQQEVYVKIQMLEEMYLPELNEMHQKITHKVCQIDSNTQSYNLTFPQPKPNEHERPKLLKIKVTLERNIAFLKVSKSDISYALKEQLPLMEDQIITFVKVNRSLDHHLRYKLYLLSMRGNLEEFILSKTDFD